MILERHCLFWHIGNEYTIESLFHDDCSLLLGHDINEYPFGIGGFEPRSIILQ